MCEFSLTERSACLHYIRGTEAARSVVYDNDSCLDNQGSTPCEMTSGDGKCIWSKCFKVAEKNPTLQTM